MPGKAEWNEEELADIRDMAERGRAPSRLTTLALVDNLRQARRERDAALSERDEARAEVKRLNLSVEHLLR